MAWEKVPGDFRIPDCPCCDYPQGIWRGYGNDEGLYQFETDWNWGGWIMVKKENFVPTLLVDGSEMTPVYDDVNGYIYWQGSPGYIYYSREYGWILCSQFPGYEPLENYEFTEEGVKWTGDSFYSAWDLPYYPNDEEELFPRGSNYDKGESKKLTIKWPRWVKDSGRFGPYTGTDGRTGTKYFGLPRFRGDGEFFVRSLNHDRYYCYTYGRIHYENGKWVIGTIGSTSGWHEGSEPKKEGSVTFVFMKPEGSEAEGHDITVSLYDYVEGEESSVGYVGEVSIWR